MKTIESILNEELKRLKEIIQRAKERITNAPAGAIRVRCWKGVVEYYYKDPTMQDADENKSNGRYLKKSEEDIARRIAQRDYDIKTIRRAEERAKAIEKFLEVYQRTCLKKLYQETNLHRRTLIIAEEITDEEYVTQWLSVEYEGKSFVNVNNEIFTERGERVRSKSEKIIADKLYALGIPYRYECPLVLSKNNKFHPDFTILKMPERKEVYMEHLGMMDDADYVEHAMYKLNTYEKNGIYLGEKLFITQETSKNPLNTRVLEDKLRRLFLPEGMNQV